MYSSRVALIHSYRHELEDFLGDFPDEFHPGDDFHQMILLPSRTPPDHVQCLFCLEDFVLLDVPVRSVCTFAQHGSTCDLIGQWTSRDSNLRRFHT